MNIKKLGCQSTSTKKKKKEMKRLTLMFNEQELAENEFEEKYITTFLPSEFHPQDYTYKKDLEFTTNKYIHLDAPLTEEISEEYKKKILSRLTNNASKVIVSFTFDKDDETPLERFRRYCGKHDFPFAIYDDGLMVKARFFAKVQPDKDFYENW